jgi:hypothetical protein
MRLGGGWRRYSKGYTQTLAKWPWITYLSLECQQNLRDSSLALELQLQIREIGLEVIQLKR